MKIQRPNGARRASPARCRRVAPNLFLLSELRACSATKFFIAKDLQVKFVFLKGLGTEICPISGALRRFGTGSY